MTGHLGPMARLAAEPDFAELLLVSQEEYAARRAGGCRCSWALSPALGMWRRKYPHSRCWACFGRQLSDGDQLAATEAAGFGGVLVQETGDGDSFTAAEVVLAAACCQLCGTPLPASKGTKPRTVCSNTCRSRLYKLRKQASLAQVEQQP